MKVLLSWLREFCPTDLSAGDLAERLTAQGAKVEAITRPWERLQGVIVARVLEVRDHPNSDRLCVARVGDGSGEREVVVGVRNMRPGDLVPLAGPGATVPALDAPLARREIRGVPSDGMLCSPWELGIAPEHTAILILPPGTRIGADVRSEFGLDDALLDIEVKSNRPDLMCVAGVAREAAAATGVPFSAPDPWVREIPERADSVASVEIQDLERCPLYVARIIRGVHTGASPILVQARLTATGMRPVSNVVDATNYVMLEMGQPLHPFDLALLKGSGIVVRRAEQGERMVTLDDIDRTLTPDDLVIADLVRGVAIGGVMGAAVAEVSDSTADILLESANFERRGVARISNRLNLKTEASIRFERGVDPEAAPRAAARAARFMVEWGGGEVLAGAAQAGAPPGRRHLFVRAARTSLLLGYPVTASEIEDALSRLVMTTRPEDSSVDVEVPSYRPDLEREIDLIEEVARIQGYDRVGTTLPGVRQPGGVAASYALRRRVRRALQAAGLREAMSTSFASSADLELIGQSDADAVRVANPLAADDAFLRTSLLPGLLRAARHNFSRGARGVALFEVGRAFRASPGPDRTGDRPIEELDLVAGLMAGSAWGEYPDVPRAFDFLDGKGAVEALLEALAIGKWDLVGLDGPPPFLHPARWASLSVNGTRAGIVGELHPRVAERLDLPQSVQVFELDTARLRAAAQDIGYREIARFPPLRRDLAFLVDRSVPVSLIREGIVQGSGGLAQKVLLFDVYEGDPLPRHKKNVAFSVDFRAADRTLTDEEVSAAIADITRLARLNFGGELRTR